MPQQQEKLRVVIVGRQGDGGEGRLHKKSRRHILAWFEFVIMADPATQVTAFDAAHHNSGGVFMLLDPYLWRSGCTDKDLNGLGNELGSICAVMHRHCLRNRQGKMMRQHGICKNRLRSGCKGCDSTPPKRNAFHVKKKASVFEVLSA